MTRKEIGDAAEEYAAAFYISKGYAIAARNFRFRRLGELDIIAVKCSGDIRLIVFCEVKYRSDSDFAPPALSVNRTKIHKIRMSAEGFMLNHPEYGDYDVRFDVAEVTRDGDDFACSVIENAF